MKALSTALLLVLTGSGCLQNTGVLTKTNALSQNCSLPNSVAVANISLRMAEASVVVGSDFCASVADYTCNRKRFSPTATNGKSIVEECTHVAELGGDVCLKVNSQSYSTAEAAKRSDISASAALPGGDLNRSDYLCYHSSLVDGENYLTIGEADHLNEALAAAFVQCAGIAPRLSAGK